MGSHVDLVAQRLAVLVGHACLDPLAQELGLLLPELLLGGKPVPVENVADRLGVTRPEVLKALHDLSDVEVDDHGRVVGSGITLRETPHRIIVDRRTLFAWCAWDALTYPPLFGRRVRLESECASTGALVRMTVSPRGVRDLRPADAVVSLVIENCCCASDEPRRDGIRNTFCEHVRFFVSPHEARGWSARHPTGLLLTAEQAFEAGVRFYQMILPASRR